MDKNNTSSRRSGPSAFRFGSATESEIEVLRPMRASSHPQCQSNRFRTAMPVVSIAREENHHTGWEQDEYQVSKRDPQILNPNDPENLLCDGDRLARAGFNNEIE